MINKKHLSPIPLPHPRRFSTIKKHKTNQNPIPNQLNKISTTTNFKWHPLAINLSLSIAPTKLTLIQAIANHLQQQGLVNLLFFRPPTQPFQVPKDQKLKTLLKSSKRCTQPPSQSNGKASRLLEKLEVEALVRSSLQNSRKIKPKVLMRSTPSKESSRTRSIGKNSLPTSSSKKKFCRSLRANSSRLYTTLSEMSITCTLWWSGLQAVIPTLL